MGEKSVAGLDECRVWHDGWQFALWNADEFERSDHSSTTIHSTTSSDTSEASECLVGAIICINGISTNASCEHVDRVVRLLGKSRGTVRCYRNQIEWQKAKKYAYSKAHRKVRDVDIWKT